MDVKFGHHAISRLLSDQEGALVVKGQENRLTRVSEPDVRQLVNITYSPSDVLKMDAGNSGLRTATLCLSSVSRHVQTWIAH